MENSNQFERVKLKYSTRWATFLALYFFQFHVGQSSGILSPGGKVIKVDLQMMDMEYGSISACYAVGRIVGAFLFGHTMNAINRKYLMIFGAIVHGLVNMSYIFTSNPYWILASRTFAGIGYAFAGIYLGLWVSQFAVKKHAKLWKNLQTMSSATSRASGYFIDLFFGSHNWRYSFFYNGAALFSLGIIIMFIPSIYFSSKLTVHRGKDGEEEIRNSQADVVSIYDVRTSEVDERDPNLLRKHKKALTNGVFVCLLWARLVNLSLRSVLQFWLCKYVYTLDCNEATDKPLFTHIYAFMIILNPWFGTLIGNKLMSYVGGYKDQKSFYMLLLLQIIACLSFTPSVWFDEYWKFCIFASLYQISCSAVLPSLNGVMLGALPENIRKRTSPIINVTSMGLGTLPAPPTYGLLIDFYGMYDRKVGMRYFRNYTYLAIVLIAIASVFRSFYEKNENEEALIEKESKVIPFDVSMKANEDMIPDMKILGAEDNEEVELTNISDKKKKKKKATKK